MVHEPELTGVLSLEGGASVVKVIVPVGLLPSGSKVTKLTGMVMHEVVRELRVFGPGKGEPPQVLTAGPTVVFLMNGTASLSAISGDTEVVWHARPDDLLDALTYIEDK